MSGRSQAPGEDLEVAGRALQQGRYDGRNRNVRREKGLASEAGIEAGLRGNSEVLDCSSLKRD